MHPGVGFTTIGNTWWDDDIPTITTRVQIGSQSCTTHGRNSVSSAALGPNLDTRGDGGYIVVPPSIADSGEAYTWVHSPDSVALADTPEWLIALTAKAAEKEHTSRDASDDEVIEAGSRNDTLFKR